jgi:hypothetical protein
MMRRFVGTLIALLLLASGMPRVRAAPALGCRADAFPVAAAGTVMTRALPYFVEVELTVTSRARFDLLVDPGRFTLVPEKGDPITPAGRAQVIDALQRPSPVSVGFFGIFSVGSVGVAVGAYPLDLAVRTVDSRMLKRGTLAPEATIKGSVFFAPAAWPAQFAVSLDGLAGSSGSALPSVVLPACRMPFVPSEPPVSFGAIPTGARSIAVSAQAEAGPIAIRVSNVEFTRLATSLTIEVENAADIDADLFTAIGEARVTDASGTRYTVRMLPSDLPDRVPARGRGRGRLVFEPLPIPPALNAATLVIPGVRVGAAAYDLTIDLRF